MKKLLVFSIVTFISAFAIAIRVVGNAGGESELKLREQFENLPTWLKFCGENPEDCFADNNQSQSLLPKLNKNFPRIESIEFVNQKDLSDQNPSNGLIISHESLYLDEKTPKAGLDIFEVLLLNLAYGPKVQKNLQISLLPEAVSHSSLPVALLTGSASDFLVALNSKQNLHRDLTQKLKSPYRVLTVTAQGYVLKALASDYTYELLLIPSGESFQLKLIFRDEI